MKLIKFEDKNIVRLIISGLALVAAILFLFPFIELIDSGADNAVIESVSGFQLAFGQKFAEKQLSLEGIKASAILGLTLILLIVVFFLNLLDLGEFDTYKMIAVGFLSGFSFLALDTVQERFLADHLLLASQVKVTPFFTFAAVLLMVVFVLSVYIAAKEKQENKLDKFVYPLIKVVFAASALLALCLPIVKVSNSVTSYALNLGNINVGNTFEKAVFGVYSYAKEPAALIAYIGICLVIGLEVLNFFKPNKVFKAIELAVCIIPVFFMATVKLHASYIFTSNLNSCLTGFGVFTLSSLFLVFFLIFSDFVKEANKEELITIAAIACIIIVIFGGYIKQYYAFTKYSTDTQYDKVYASYFEIFGGKIGTMNTVPLVTKYFMWPLPCLVGSLILTSIPTKHKKFFRLGASVLALVAGVFLLLAFTKGFKLEGLSYKYVELVNTAVLNIILCLFAFMFNLYLGAKLPIISEK